MFAGRPASACDGYRLRNESIRLGVERRLSARLIAPTAAAAAAAAVANIASPSHQSTVQSPHLTDGFALIIAHRSSPSARDKEQDNGSYRSTRRAGGGVFSINSANYGILLCIL